MTGEKTVSKDSFCESLRAVGDEAFGSRVKEIRGLCGDRPFESAFFQAFRAICP